jgi:DNA-binding CsgD family transcriptional regulator
MTLPVSGAVSVQPAGTPVPAPASTQQTPQPTPSSDTVVLSQSAQINQLYLQGQSPEQIAENLGLAESTVNSDLGLVATIVTPQPAAGPVATSAKGTSGA